MMKKLLLVVLSAVWGFVCYGQKGNAEPLGVDDIQIDVKEVKLSATGDTAIVDLFLISYKRGGREFKLNTFASGIIDSQGKPYLYSSVQMGRVKITLSDRKNYMHYFMEEDVPVSLQIKTASWKKQWGKPQQVKLTFEDSTEEGKFLEVTVNL